MKKIALDTQMLYDRLSQAKPGDIITYRELTKIIGRNVQKDAYPCLHTARKRTRRLDRLAFGVIRNRGLQCLKDDEIVGAGYTALKRVRSRARDGFKTLVCLEDYSNLSDIMKIKHNTVATILMMVNKATKPKVMELLEGTVAEKMQKLSFKQTIEFFEKRNY